MRTAKSTLVAATKMRTGERCIVAALTAARNAFKTTNVATIPLNTVERYINRTVRLKPIFTIFLLSAKDNWATLGQTETPDS